MIKKRLMLCLLVSTFCMMLFTPALHAQTNPPSISSIKDIEAVVVQGKYYKLPATVEAVFSNQKVAKVAVRWDKSNAVTSKIGTFTYNGTVKDYNKPITLTLRVIAPIVSVKNLEMTVPTNAKLSLPALVEAVCKDQAIYKVPVAWKPSALNTSKPGKYTFQGAVTYFSKKVSLVVTVKDLYSMADNINVILNHNQVYMLPTTIKAAAFDKTQADAKVTWSKPSIDTSKVGKGVLEGVVEGYSKKVLLNYEVVPVIASVPEKNITFIRGDLFYLPKDIEVTMSDGSKKIMPITWTPAQIDLTRVGTTEVAGKVNGYDKPIKWLINMKTDLMLLSKKVNYTQWDYIPILFNKDLVPCTKLDGIILKDEDGVQIKIKEVYPGVNYKTNLLVIPAHELAKNKTYTLTIFKNTIQDVDGDFYPEDITFTFRYE